MYNRRSTRNSQPQDASPDLAVGSRRPKRGITTTPEQSLSAAMVQQQNYVSPVAQQQTAGGIGQAMTQQQGTANNAAQNSTTEPQTPKNANFYQGIVTSSMSQPTVLPMDSLNSVQNAGNSAITGQNTSDIQMKSEEEALNGDEKKNNVPFWKNRKTGPRNLAAIRKRENAKLRRVIQPKTPLSILNELKIPAEFEVVPSPIPVQFNATVKASGVLFEAVGKSIMEAKNAAAEKLLQSIFRNKIEELKKDETTTAVNPELTGTDDNQQEQPPAKKGKFEEQDDFSWGALASYAIYKLLGDWKAQGFEPDIPLAKMLAPKKSSSGSAPAENSLRSVYDGPVKSPPNIPGLHPACIVNCMFPGIKITEVMENNTANLAFGSIVAIGPNVFYAQAKNKKEAKKACCEKILQHYNVPYNQ